jgi:pimeloyl-ACP methyl ester carboxylesterase
MRSLLILLITAAALNGQTSVDRYLSSLAESALEKRIAVTGALTQPAAAARREEIRAKVLAQIGGLPATKTALNPRITGGFTREGYRVENLVFESLPNFYVTANVYVPTGAPGPFPAVLGVAGHSANGKASATYQHVWISLARRGYLVLAFDPPGQGERLESFDTDAQVSRMGIGTTEHTHYGTQLLLTGNHFARYEAWDGIRAFDYLLTRKDVDHAKIAVAGNSGGGTQAAYLSVLEPRLAAIVSSCYMTSWKELWYKPGPQDGEQVFPNFLRDQLDFPDFAYAAAPKPFLMTTAIRDFFPIDGARRTHGEIKKFYTLFDADAKAGYFEFDDTHGWSKPRREAAYRFLDQWLKGQSTDGAEAPLETEPEQNLYATKTGQVQSSFHAATTQSLNAAEALRLHESRAAKTRGVDRKMVLDRIGFDVTTQRFHESTITMPGTLGTRPPAVLAINASKEDLGEMVLAGNAVLNLVFPAGDPSRTGYTPQYQTSSRALLVGRTLLGLQLSDVLQAFNELAANQTIDPKRIRLYARGNAAVVGLHAMYLTPQIESAALEAMPLSWLAITQAKMHRGLIDIIVPGALKDYDLPDLAAAIAPRPVWLVDTRGPAGQMLLKADVEKSYGKATINYRPEGWKFSKVYAAWLR